MRDSAAPHRRRPGVGVLEFVSAGPALRVVLLVWRCGEQHRDGQLGQGSREESSAMPSCFAWSMTVIGDHCGNCSVLLGRHSLGPVDDPLGCVAVLNDREPLRNESTNLANVDLMAREHRRKIGVHPGLEVAIVDWVMPT